MGRKVGGGPRQRAIRAAVESGRPYPLHGRDKQDTSNLRKSAAVLVACGKVEVIRVPGDALGERVYAVPVGFVWTDSEAVGVDTKPAPV